MEKFGLNQLREMFLSFFESKGHLRLPSFSLIPQNDASLLLIISGEKLYLFTVRAAEYPHAEGTGKHI